MARKRKKSRRSRSPGDTSSRGAESGSGSRDAEESPEESVELINLDLDAEDDAGAMAALLAETVALADRSAPLQSPDDSEVSFEEPDASGGSHEKADDAETSVDYDDSSSPAGDSVDHGEGRSPVDQSESTVSLDLDEDDEYDRDRLIAEAIAFAEADESGTEPATPAKQEADTPEGADTEPPRSVTFPPNPGVAPLPTIGADALAALSAMSSQGVTLPDELILDLGEATTPEDRDRLLAAALAHVEMQDAVYRVSAEQDRQSSRWKGAAAALLFIVAMTVVAQPPGWIVPEAPASLTAADRLEGVRLTLLLQVRQIEVYQAREGRLPDSLADVAVVLPDVRFVKSNNRVYQLVAYTSSGEAILYDSAAPAGWFDELAVRWTTPQAGS